VTEIGREFGKKKGSRILVQEVLRLKMNNSTEGNDTACYHIELSLFHS
jgi:hypothetical protein